MLYIISYAQQIRRELDMLRQLLASCTDFTSEDGNRHFTDFKVTLQSEKAKRQK